MQYMCSILINFLSFCLFLKVYRLYLRCLVLVQPDNKRALTTTRVLGPRDRVSICYHIKFYCLRKLTTSPGKF